jgi:hypothetical protein
VLGNSERGPPQLAASSFVLRVLAQLKQAHAKERPNLGPLPDLMQPIIILDS